MPETFSCSGLSFFSEGDLKRLSVTQWSESDFGNSEVKFIIIKSIGL